MTGALGWAGLLAWLVIVDAVTYRAGLWAAAWITRKLGPS